MRNVTITLEDEVARWARVRAARNDTSVSRLVGEMLQEQMLLEESYRQAKDSFFAVKPRPLAAEGTSYPSREEVHERSRLR